MVGTQVRDDKFPFFLVVGGLLIIPLVLWLIYVGEQIRIQQLAKFDYEKMVGVGKDFEFAVCDKLKPCSCSSDRNQLSLMVQRVVRREAEWSAATKTTQIHTKYYTFYTIYCGRCGKKTMNENRNLADAVLEWEVR